MPTLQSMINNATMEIYTVKEWQENWEDLLSRVQNGERIGVENEKGNRAVMMPADDELLRIYTDHDEAN